VLGDLAIGPQGDVFITDSNHPELFRLRPGSDTLERMSSPLFQSLQGAAATPDGTTLYLADYSIGLLRVDLTTGQVSRLDNAIGTFTLGCDGIVLDRTGAIIAVQNGVSPARIVRFLIDAGRTRITRAEVLDRNVRVADEPTIGTIVGSRFVYVANSQWEKYDESGHRKTSIPLTAPVLLAVPLTATYLPSARE
jgi:sugar lactone lactonase YvrE